MIRILPCSPDSKVLSQPGRNDPCPCGSGKKFKKCHGKTVSIATSSEKSRADAEKALDRTLAERLMKYASVRGGKDFMDRALSLYSTYDEKGMDEIELQLAIPWALYHYPLSDDDVSVAELYAAEKSRNLPADLNRVLDANLNAWLGVWEISNVEKNVGALVSDLLTGEERFVYETLGTSHMDVRSAVLARVITSNGISFFGGLHPQALPPRDVSLVVRHGKRLCRVRTRPAKPEKLRDPEVQISIISLWRWLVDERRNAPLPILTNTDGDQIAPTIDHFDIVTDDRSDLLTRLASIIGAHEAHREAKGSDRMLIEITRAPRPGEPQGETVVGRILISGKRLRAECNSPRRADALKASIESCAGDLVRYRLREEENIEEIFRKAAAEAGHRRSSSEERQTPEMAAITREYRERYMSEWLDMSIPALNGLTPREATRTRASKRELETLLREMEMHEGRLPEAERIDVEKLREELGMED